MPDTVQMVGILFHKIALRKLFSLYLECVNSCKNNTSSHIWINAHNHFFFNVNLKHSVFFLRVLFFHVESYLQSSHKMKQSFFKVQEKFCFFHAGAEMPDIVQMVEILFHKITLRKLFSLYLEYSNSCKNKKF